MKMWYTDTMRQTTRKQVLERRCARTGERKQNDWCGRQESTSRERIPEKEVKGTRETMREDVK